MSTLWTPGGEVPVDRNPAEQEPDPAPAPAEGVDDPELAAQMQEMQRQLLEAPAADVIAQHLMAFYELAAMHLGSDQPRLSDAKLAIDAIDALLQGLAGRLGPAEEAIGSALPQLKMAFVDAKDRVTAPGDPG